MEGPTCKFGGWSSPHPIMPQVYVPGWRELTSKFSGRLFSPPPLPPQHEDIPDLRQVLAGRPWVTQIFPRPWAPTKTKRAFFVEREGPATERRDSSLEPTSRQDQVKRVRTSASVACGYFSARTTMIMRALASLLKVRNWE